MASKRIRDVIYGFIELDEQELEIIDHPKFQRLRRIRQLAFTDTLYPGACHTRFEHSLGVMQMATYMKTNIRERNAIYTHWRNILRRQTIKAMVQARWNSNT